MRNLHVGDDSKYVVAKLSAEDIEYFRPQLKKNRKPQYTPSAHDSVERLACLGGMALDRTYGFAMSLKEKNVVSEPHLCCFSMCHDKEFLDELMINTLISAYTQVLIKKKLAQEIK